MTFDYTGLANTAVAQIADKGRDVQIVYRTEGTLDIDNDQMNGASEDTVTVRALVTNLTQRDKSFSLIEDGDQQVMIAATDATKPRTNDKVIDAGVTYTVVTVLEIKPGETPILYKLQVRK